VVQVPRLDPSTARGGWHKLQTAVRPTHLDTFPRDPTRFNGRVPCSLYGENHVS
jgi:hypothetical protein